MYCCNFSLILFDILSYSVAAGMESPKCCMKLAALETSSVFFFLKKKYNNYNGSNSFFNFEALFQWSAM